MLNRRGFEQRLRQEMAAATRHGEGGVVIYIDLDGFKPINDTHGHAAGDAVLAHVAILIERNVRESDIVGRIGGDEFTVLMPHTLHVNGLARASQLRRRLNNSVVSWHGALIPVRASLGMRPYVPGDTWTDVLMEADKDMYRVKTLTRVGEDEKV